MNIFDASPKNIWNYKQNHPELVIKDLKKFGISNEIQNIVRQSMLCRGINKWLKVRRDLIAYKKQIKHQVKNEIQKIKYFKQQVKNNYVSNKDIIEKNKTLNDFNIYNRTLINYLIAKEKLKLLQEFRKNLKKLCITDRWQIWEGKHLEEMNSIKCSD